MYVETIPFEHNMPVTFDAYKMSYYHLHCHEGVIEVLIILSGSAHVKVSFEQFDLKEGDYIIINNGDSHSIYATDSRCQTASLYFHLESYREQIPYLDYVLFACESFDLVKYKNETQYLRRMISNVLLNLARVNLDLSGCDSHEYLKKAAEELLWIFVNDYDMKNYYSRNWNAGFSKTEKYYKIMKYIFENYDKKNLMEFISKNEFYSKSYITHLFKQVGASSFQDVLTYVRLYKSEKMLLDSDVPIIEIADRCGFSDIKYYTSNFKKWFLSTPSEYRKVYQPEVLKNSLSQRLRDEDVMEKMDDIIKHNRDNTEYKAAINPLSVKIKDTCMQFYEEGNLIFHQICISIDDKSDIQDLVLRFPSLKEEGFIPVFIISYHNMSMQRCRDIIAHCSRAFSGSETLDSNVEIIIAYNNPKDKPDVNKLLRDCADIKKVVLKPMLMV